MRPGRGKNFGASRGARSNTARSAILIFSVAFVHPHLLLCVENLIACLCDRLPQPVIDASRLADAKRCASHEASAPAGLDGRASEPVCYPRLSGNSSHRGTRTPKG